MATVGQVLCSSTLADQCRGIVFGFVSSPRGRKSSQPERERDWGAKKFFICLPSLSPDFQTRLPCGPTVQCEGSGDSEIG